MVLVSVLFVQKMDIYIYKYSFNYLSLFLNLYMYIDIYKSISTMGAVCMGVAF